MASFYYGRLSYQWHSRTLPAVCFVDLDEFQLLMETESRRYR